VSIVVAVVRTLSYGFLAWFLSRRKVWEGEMVSLLVWLPWAIPGILLGTAFLSVFLNVAILSALLPTLGPLILVLIVQNLPLGTHMLRSSVTQISSELEEASYVSGGGRLTTLRRITLPLVMPTLTSWSS
jgi:iron(III) transport system permease protein